MFITLAKLIQ